MILTEEQLAVISRTAAQAVAEHFEQKQRKQRKQEEQKHDRRLHNIRLLLKNYRSLVLHCEDIVDGLSIIDSMSIQDLDISTISLESIESIKKSREKSLAMVIFVQTKMEAYKNSCTEEELRYFRVLEKKYLTEKKYTILDIADEEGIDRATVYRYLDKIIEDLPVIFFGVDAIDFK